MSGVPSDFGPNIIAGCLAKFERIANTAGRRALKALKIWQEKTVMVRESSGPGASVKAMAVRNNMIDSARRA